jgi:hypothetical protein
MVHCIFTLDYEVRGDGSGSLEELVYRPAQELLEIFRKAGAPFVPFVEVAELEMIEAEGSDPAIDLVKQQVREFYLEGMTPALHLHPQWYGARFDGREWAVNYAEYNLCTLPEPRVAEIVDRAIAYFRRILGAPDFTPLAFRAGNWLFQPTRTAAAVLFDRGIRIDSSVFKGGVRHEHGLDYRAALANGYYWRFTESADVAEPKGALLELPILTQMVPFWRLANSKRLALERQQLSNRSLRKKIHRARDVARLWHPLKFDFCRMSLNELSGFVEAVIDDDRRSPDSIKPIVAIGHTKELVDIQTIDRFLAYLKSSGVAISTFEQVYAQCAAAQPLPVERRQDARSNGQ